MTTPGEHYLVDTDEPVIVYLPVASATVIRIGDACYVDEAATQVKTASQQADQGSEDANQRLFARNFAGISISHSRSGDTDDVAIAVRGVVDVPCEAATYKVGDFLAPDENSNGDALENQSWVKVTDPDRACLQVVEAGSSVTRVKARILRRFLGTPIERGMAREALAVRTLTGALTLLVTDAQIQLIDPGGADRVVTLPAKTQGLVYEIGNTADADETLTIQDDAEVAVVYLRQGERVKLACDGTSWRILSQGFDGPEPANEETLAANKTLTDLDLPIQRLDPGGSARDVTLPAEGPTNRPFLIVNTADAAEVITIKNDAGTTLGTPTQGESALCVPDGTNWQVIVGASS